MRLFLIFQTVWPSGETHIHKSLEDAEILYDILRWSLDKSFLFPPKKVVPQLFVFMCIKPGTPYFSNSPFLVEKVRLLCTPTFPVKLRDFRKLNGGFFFVHHFRFQPKNMKKCVLVYVYCWTVKSGANGPMTPAVRLDCMNILFTRYNDLHCL